MNTVNQLKQAVIELEHMLEEHAAVSCDPKEVLLLLEVSYRELSGKDDVKVKESYGVQDISDKLSLIKSALANPREGYDPEKAFIPLETARRKMSDKKRLTNGEFCGTIAL
jgi:hypothetical protein